VPRGPWCEIDFEQETFGDKYSLCNYSFNDYFEDAY
jgi:hypothetical protein